MKAELIDVLGDDLRVVNAARVSFNKESEYKWDCEFCGDDRSRCWEFDEVCGYGMLPLVGKKVLSNSDIKLINYLAKHGHWTPFSHPQITVRETVPIFVARQRFKHMVGFTYNEVSRRYVDDDPEFYVPDVWRSKAESKKQGSGEEVSPRVKWLMDYDYTSFLGICEEQYKRALKRGVCPEQARMVLPQSMYTSYYVTGSLAAWARAYKQRIDPHSQVEIQELAKQWNTIMSPLFPVSWNALTTLTQS